MILGSHNSMTYLPSKKWWMWFFRFMACCQGRDFKKQYELGVRFFDFRLIFKYGKKYLDEPMFCHGQMVFDDKVGINDVLTWLNEQGGVYVRLIFERGDDLSKDYFVNWCSKVEEKYPEIKFVDFRDKKSWKNLHPSKNNYPCTLLDKYASCNQTGVNKWKGILRSKNWSGLLIDDLWPWIYSKLNNRKNYLKYKNEDVILMLDFVNEKLVVR